MSGRPLDGPYHGLRRLTEGLAVLAGWALLGLSIAIVVEVVLRKAFRTSLQGVDELGGYLFAVTATVGFAYALFTRSHIRIDVLLRTLPPPAKAVADVIALLLLNFFVWMLLWRAVAVAWQSWSFNAMAVSPLETPLYIPQALWALAMALFAVAAAVSAIRAFLALRQRDWAASAAEFGIVGAEEEVAEEVEALRRRQTADTPSA